MRDVISRALKFTTRSLVCAMRCKLIRKIMNEWIAGWYKRIIARVLPKSNLVSNWQVHDWPAQIGGSPGRGYLLCIHQLPWLLPLRHLLLVHFPFHRFVQCRPILPQAMICQKGKKISKKGKTIWILLLLEMHTTITVAGKNVQFTIPTLTIANKFKLRKIWEWWLMKIRRVLWGDVVGTMRNIISTIFMNKESICKKKTLTYVKRKLTIGEYTEEMSLFLLRF